MSRNWPKAVVFDLDGTLVDSAPDIAEALNIAMAPLGARAHCSASVEALAGQLVSRLHHGDQLLIMSNGGFGGLHDKVLAGLAARAGKGG